MAAMNTSPFDHFLLVLDGLLCIPRVGEILTTLEKNTLIEKYGDDMQISLVLFYPHHYHYRGCRKMGRHMSGFFFPPAGEPPPMCQVSVPGVFFSRR